MVENKGFIKQEIQIVRYKLFIRDNQELVCHTEDNTYDKIYLALNTYVNSEFLLRGMLMELVKFLIKIYHCFGLI